VNGCDTGMAKSLNDIQGYNQEPSWAQRKIKLGKHHGELCSDHSYNTAKLWENCEDFCKLPSDSPGASGTMPFLLGTNTFGTNFGCVCVMQVY
jgi:hypothetical protein